ncbi:protein kinase domain-containing protein [Haloplanus halophilus]|uniref:protein kinase domain-containing protein n=1 Tax=Haloplanus halophilus TaxID=2949993 RepID=UPI00203C8DD8|nr:protein kinase [Haloplanus sp. GDY1]
MTDSRVPDLSTVSSPPRRELTYEDIEIVERIGHGGEAVVSRADVVGGDPPERIALKEPLSPETVTVDAVEEFLAEAERWETVDSRERRKPRWSEFEHVVGVIDTGESRPWIALEYMDGGSLDGRLESAPDGLPLQKALWIGECVCRGVAVAHGYGIAHLDLKPANVLFRETPGDSWDVPKVADWGLARVLAEQSGATDGLSVTYAAPEQFEPADFGDPDTLTDVYQIGTLLYAMLTGDPPYTGTRLGVLRDVVGSEAPPPPSAHREDVTAAMDAAVLHALERDKTARYRSVENFADALRAIRTGNRPDRFLPNFDSDGSEPSGGAAGGSVSTHRDRDRDAGSAVSPSDTTITTVGVGDAGSNTVDRLDNMGVDGVETVAINTDKQHLQTIDADAKLPVGKSLTRGSDAGGEPSVGERSAELARETIENVLDGTDLVFVTVGMGGGTGTGTAPTVAEIANEQDALVVGVASTPLDADRDEVARRGVTELRSEVDSLVVLDDDHLIEHVPDLSTDRARSVMDQIIAETVRDVGGAVAQTSLVELDLSDVATVLQDDGEAAIFVGETENGDETGAVDDALKHPLVDADYRKASAALVHVTGGPDLTAGEARDLVNEIADRVDPGGSVVWGAERRPAYEGKTRLYVLLTGIDGTPA